MMRKRKLLILFMTLSLTLIGCGKDNTEEVAIDVSEVMESVMATDSTVTENTVVENTETVPHEHNFVYTANGDRTHTVNCKYDCCSYSQQEDCTYVHYECQVCAQAYPWEQDIDYFDGTFYWDKGIYYAQKELNIYKYPDLESEIIGTLAVNDAVSCVGRIILGKEYDYLNFWITEDGRCIPNSYDYNTNRRDLREGTTNQVVVKYMTLSGNTWSPLKMHGVYDSYDAALQDLCGTTWTDIKANWRYNDYKSQGQNFMSSYSEGVSGKSVSTRNLTDPYGYSDGGAISYQFE